MSVVDVLRQKPMVEYIPEAIRKSDGTYRCCCPVHGGDNETSFAIFDDNKFYCFACHASGDIINYKMEKDNIPFAIAVKELANDFSLPLDNDYIQEQNLVDKKEFQSKAYENKVDSIIEYLMQSRGFSEETVKKFRLGYSEKSKAVTIPMFDEYGRLVCFGYRYFENKVKYKNGKNNPPLFEKGKYLYGINFAIERLKQSDTLYVCEGYFDMISADEQGLACVAYCGITLTADHVKLIKQIIGRREIKIVLVPDNDNRADKFINRAKELFRTHASNLLVEVMQIEDGYKDLNELHVAKKDIKKQVVKDINFFLAEFILKQNKGLDVQKKKIMELVSTVKDPLVRLSIAEYLSKEWKKPLDVIKEFLSVKEESIDEVLNEFSSLANATSSLITEENNELNTGYEELDGAINLYKKQITTIAAPSNTGKTDFLIELLLNLSIVQQKRILFFSLEMSKEDVSEIILAKLLQQPRWKIKQFILEHPLEANNYINKIGTRLQINDKVLSLADIDERIKIAKTNIFVDEPLDIVAIDHFGLLRNNTTVEQQSKNADGLIPLAKNHNVCLIILAQLNKASQVIEKGRIREPMQTDISGSASLGNASTTILGLWRPEKTPGMSEISKENWKNITRLKILKHRKLKRDKLYFQLTYNTDTSRLVMLKEQEERSELD